MADEKINSLIHLNNVYDHDEIVKDLSFDVIKHSVTGFVGLNGAGKTTTLKTILQFKKIKSGEIKYFGLNDFTKQIRSKIGFLPERPYFYPYLTGQEFLKLHWDLQSDVEHQQGILSASNSKPNLHHEFNQRCDYWLTKLELNHARHRRLKNYSKGMLQRIGIAQSVIHDPELLIWDEPMSGLDPQGRQLVREILIEKKQKGTTIFFSSHLLQDITELCDRIVVIHQGRKIFEGPREDFEIQNQTLEQTFLTKIKQINL